MENDGENNLANLPPDIIRLIFHMEKPELIDHLRLISPDWKSLIDDYFENKSQLPTIDFLCLNFIASSFKRENKLEMIIIGRKSKFGGAETHAFYMMTDLRLVRILRRCSKINTLLLNMPVRCEFLVESSGFPMESRALIRAYIGNTQIRLVKIASVFDIDAVVRNIISDLARFNSAGNFEIEVKDIHGLLWGGFIEAHLGQIQSIKCYDYTNKHLTFLSTFPFALPGGPKTWSDLVQILNKIDGVQVEFTPLNDDYHLHVITKKIEEKRNNLVKVLPNLNQIHGKAKPKSCHLSKSIERIREEIRKVKETVSKLQSDSSFDLNKFLLSDDILLTLNRIEKFEKAPEIENNLSNLPQEIVQTIIRMENPESVDNLRLISPTWKTLVDEFLSNINNMPAIVKCLEFAESETNPLKLKLETIGMCRHSTHFNDDWSEYLVSDPRFYRIQRRCSIIETLYLKMPSGGHFDHETIDILRKYVGTIPVKLVKVVGLAKFDILARNAFFHLARVNGARNFEVDTRCIDGLQLDYFLNITMNLDSDSQPLHEIDNYADYKIQTIKFRDYGHKPQSTFFFNEDESVWMGFVNSMNARERVRADFRPFGDGFHLKIVTRPENRAIRNEQSLAIPKPRIPGMQRASTSGIYHTDPCLASYFDGSKIDLKSENQWFQMPKPDKNREEIEKSVKIMREELKKINRSVKQLQSSSTFDLEQFIASDNVLLALRHYLTRQ